MKSMNIEKIEIFDPKELERVGKIYVGFFKRRVISGQDYKGRTFPPYSPLPRTLVKSTKELSGLVMNRLTTSEATMPRTMTIAISG